MSLRAIFGLMIAACWLVFCLYWLISARSAKPNARNSNYYIQWGIRALLVAAIIVRLHFGGAAHLFAGRPVSPILGAAGVALCVLGIALAIWARVYLGRNWGMPMSRKENPELITTGPYWYVRHPIYTGMLLAILGSALATGLLRLAAVDLFLCAYFVYSAVQEQKIMLKEFPDAYPAYMKRTKMLIPFVL
jgi:protein-S-isoprenylcysteine O-methyltransferase Ste14